MAMKRDETTPGGRYMVGGRFVDASGVEVQEEEAFDVEVAPKADLIAEAERRGITVKRADGKDADPTVDDYRSALR